MATFFKTMHTKYDPSTDVATGTGAVQHGDFTSSVTRTYYNTIDNLNQINISFNGQSIPRRTTEAIDAFAKYYWEGVLFTNPDGVTISVYANEEFVATGYLDITPEPADCHITIDDIIFIEYTYEEEILG